MNDLTSRWTKLSLSNKEGSKVKAVNIDAVAKNFGSLWRARQGFHIRDAGNNHLIFAFKLKADVEKVLLGFLIGL